MKIEPDKTAIDPIEPTNPKNPRLHPLSPDGGQVGTAFRVDGGNPPCLTPYQRRRRGDQS